MRTSKRVARGLQNARGVLSKVPMWVEEVVRRGRKSQRGSAPTAGKPRHAESGRTMDGMICAMLGVEPYVGAGVGDDAQMYSTGRVRG